MAGFGRKPCLIDKMSSSDLYEITQMLDADKKWKELASLMGCPQDVISRLDYLTIKQEKSPSEEVIIWYYQRCHDTNDLFKMLLKMKHLRSANLLKEKGYVDRENYKYLNALLAERDKVASGDPSSLMLLSSRNYELPLGVGPPAAISVGDVQSSRNSQYNNLNVACENTAYYDKNKSKHVGQPVAGASRSPAAGRPVQNTEYFPSNGGNKGEKGGNDDKQFMDTVECEKAKLGPATDAAAGKLSPVTDGVGVDQNTAGSSLSTTNNESVRGSATSTLVQSANWEPATAARKAEAASSPGDVYTQCLPYSDMLKATDNFNESFIIGQGAFGTVYKGTLWETAVAIKQMNLAGRFQDRHHSHEVGDELKTLLRYRHENIVLLYACSIDGPQPCLIYQYMTNGSLEDRLQCKNNTAVLSYPQRSDIARGAARGIQYLHTSKPPLVHGDIKSANILLSKSMEAKLCDFGLCREGPGAAYTHVSATRIHGTPAYLPPEYIRSKQLSQQLDTYSFGIVLLELVTGEKAYDSGRGKEDAYILQYVMRLVKCAQSEAILSLWDQRLAGQQSHCKDIFLGLCRLAVTCTCERKKERPAMIDVLKQLEKLDIEHQINTSPMTTTTQHVADTDCNSEAVSGAEAASERPMTPLELQQYHDSLNRR